MSKPRLAVTLRFPTQAMIEPARAQVQSLVSASLPFAIDRTVGWLEEDGRPWLMVDARFDTEAKRNAVRTVILNAVSSHAILQQRLEGTLSWHLCTHDDLSIKNCKTTGYGELIL